MRFVWEFLVNGVYMGTTCQERDDAQFWQILDFNIGSLLFIPSFSYWGVNSL